MVPLKRHKSLGPTIIGMPGSSLVHLEQNYIDNATSTIFQRYVWNNPNLCLTPDQIAAFKVLTGIDYELIHRWFHTNTPSRFPGQIMSTASAFIKPDPYRRLFGLIDLVQSRFV